jgi:hypothetical protein
MPPIGDEFERLFGDYGCVDNEVGVIMIVSVLMALLSLVGSAILVLLSSFALVYDQRRLLSGRAVLHLLVCIGASDFAFSGLWLADVIFDRCAFARAFNPNPISFCEHDAFVVEYALSVSLDYAIVVTSLWTAIMAWHLRCSLQSRSGALFYGYLWRLHAGVWGGTAVAGGVTGVLVKKACSHDVEHIVTKAAVNAFRLVA